MGSRSDDTLERRARERRTQQTKCERLRTGNSVRHASTSNKQAGCPVARRGVRGVGRPNSIKQADSQNSIKQSWLAVFHKPSPPPAPVLRVAARANSKKQGLVPRARRVRRPVRARGAHAVGKLARSRPIPSLRARKLGTYARQGRRARALRMETRLGAPGVLRCPCYTYILAGLR